MGGRAFLHFFRDLHRRPREKTQCCLSVWIFFVNFSLSHPSLFNFLDLRGHTVASCALCVCFGGKSLASVGWMRGVGRECPPPKQSSGTALRGQDLANLSPSPPPPFKDVRLFVCPFVCPLRDPPSRLYNIFCRAAQCAFHSQPSLKAAKASNHVAKISWMFIF